MDSPKPGKRRFRLARRATSVAARKAAPPQGSEDRKRSRRESIETFVVVFLGFLIWSLEAEGFVIPTGSMAPTLMGRHKEIICPQCGYRYTVDAEREMDDQGAQSVSGRRIVAGTCENCRFETSVADAPSFSGDRIYVMKEGVSLPFLASARKVALKRWDVAVFKLPEAPDVRYIKRLVGMPDEVLRIERGDLWVRSPQGSEGFKRLRRPPLAQQATQMIVFNDTHRAEALSGDARWARWRPEGEGAWTEPAPSTFIPRAETGQWAELRYHHMVPTPAQWNALVKHDRLASPPRATLITDYNSFNSDLAADDRSVSRLASRPWLAPHWVGDLTLSCRVSVRRPGGRFRLELIKAGVSHRCEIDLGTGQAALARGRDSLGGSASTGIDQPGTYELTFANVDDRLTLWVDGRLPFGDGRSFGPDLQDVYPTAADLEPVRLAARSADVVVDRVILRRDLYYTLDPAQPDYANLGDAQYDPEAFFQLLSDPSRFRSLLPRAPREYTIRPGHYFMLGDNSPWSRDARAWGRADQVEPDRPGGGWDRSGRLSWEVPEQLLIGKAFCVYWPHPMPIWPEFCIGRDIRVPFVPYVERMRWIR
jgi:signal peptidase I